MDKKEIFYKAQLRIRLRGQHFTIISNNCWGAHVYQELNRPYETPFVGLFFHPDCYLNLLSRFRAVIANPITFVENSQRSDINKLREKYGGVYPIARLDDDIEIQFLHSRNELEAAEKWHRRVARINPIDNKLFFKFCDRDQATYSHLQAFDRLPFSNKICFVAKEYPGLKNTIYIPGCVEGVVPDGGILQQCARPHFDVADWLCRGSGRPKWHSPGCLLWRRE